MLFTTFFIKFISRLLLSLALILPASAQLTEWAGATGSTANGQSSFVSIQSSEDVITPRIFMAGNATSSFDLGSLPSLKLPSVQSGVVVGGWRSSLTKSAIHPFWQAIATSTKKVTFTDLVLLPSSKSIAVCGYFDTKIDFKNVETSDEESQISTAFSLSPGSGVHGFFALLDEGTGKWTAAYLTKSLLPASITCDAVDSVLLTGEGALAARYSATTGKVIWFTPTVTGTTRATHIASASCAPLVVLTEENLKLSEPGVVLSNLDPLTGKILWTRRMGGPGIDKAGGLAIDPYCRIHLAFSADYDLTAFDGTLVDVPDPNVGDSVFTAAVRPDGTPSDVSVAARPYNYNRTNEDLLVCNDLAVFPSGRVVLACHGAGAWAIGSFEDLFLNAEAIVIQVDPAGKTEQFLRASKDKSTTASAIGISVDGSGQVTTVGKFSGNKASDFEPATTLPSRTAAGAFVAAVKVLGEQGLFVIRDNPANATNVKLRDLHGFLKSVGAVVYAECEAESLDEDFASLCFYGTPGMVSALQLIPNIVVSQEAEMTRNGLNLSAGLALKRIAESYSDGTSFPYVDTENPVRLYLIDTAVINPTKWIAANPKLTLEKSVLVRGVGDPIDSSSFKHGTQMLSLIGGLETGAAPGIPINVVNYDIYPNGETTSITLLAKAVLDAVKDYRASGKRVPATICIASSSVTPATSYTLQSSIEMAVAEGMTVLVSAGNLGKDASAYIPAAYGVMDGVICTGASDQNDLALASSNYGAPVDLLAPGDKVLSLGLDTLLPFELFTGTSPATALTTAAAIAEISVNGTRSPADIETALKAGSRAYGKISLLQLTVGPPTSPPDTTGSKLVVVTDGLITNQATPISLTCDPAIFGMGSGGTLLDTDEDGISDIMERFRGSDPALPNSSSIQPTVALSATNELLFSFPIDGNQLDGAKIFTLRNGLSWRVTCTSNLATWVIPNGSLSKTTDAKGQVWLTATFTASQPSCFARLEVIDTSTP